MSTLTQTPELVTNRSPDGGVSPALTAGVVLLALVATLGGVFGGPPLGDHETIVALCARNMRVTGDWIVPWFLETPFFRKPPLPYWLVAGASYLFPNDPVTGLPVTTSVARLPTAISAFATILLLWHLASSMFGRRVGVVTAAVSASSLFFLLYSPNATVEMLLTFCCTWAYVHFWHAVNAPWPQRRRLHMAMFYVALGFGMLAKGPAPLALVAFPLAAWWYTHAPLKILARRGPRAWRAVIARFVRDLWPRTAAAFTRLWLIPGLVLFALVFVPWMFAVGQRFPHAWNLWNWQYWQRAQGNYEDTKSRSVFYYVPIMAGLTLPWLFLIFHAMAAPWLKAFARQHRGLLYGGLWALVGVVIMSLMTFKKPYYISPAVPGLLLLVGVVAERFYSWRPPWRAAQLLWLIAGAAALIALVSGHVWLRNNEPEIALSLTLLVAAVLALMMLSAGLFIRGRGVLAMLFLAATSVGAFQTVWHGFGKALYDVDKVAELDAVLDGLGVPSGAPIMWVDARPDARLDFYFGRRTLYLLTPDAIVNEFVDRTTRKAKERIQEMVVDRADELLGAPEPVYLVMDKRTQSQAKLFMANTGHIIGTVDADPDSTEKDWVIVTNHKPATRAAD